MGKKRHFIVTLLLIIELIIILYIGFSFDVQSKALYSAQIYDFNEGWVMKLGNSTRIDVKQLPYATKCKAGTEVVLENTLPKEFAGLSLSFLTVEKSVEVFIDDECVYEFGIQDERTFGKSPGSNMNIVDIPRHLKDGKIRIVSTSPLDDMASAVATFCVASRDISVLHLVVDNLGNVLCSILLIGIAVVIVIAGIMNYKANHNTQGLFYLALFAFGSGVYFIIQTNVLHILYGNSIVFSQIEYTVLAQLALLISIYYKNGLLKGYSNRLIIIISLSAINIIGQNIAFVFNLYEYRQMVVFSYAIISLAIGIVGVSLIQNSKKVNRRVSSYIHLIALGILTVGAQADMIRDFTVRADDMARYCRVTTTVYCLIVLSHHVAQLVRSYSQRTEENANLLEREIKQVEEQNRALRRANDEAEAAKQEAIMANTAKDNFLARISHEIRTPINAVLGMDSMILRETEEESIRSYALDIRSAGRTLLSLINDILDFSKIESGNLEIIPVEYDVSSMIHDILNMITPRANAKGIEIILNIDEGLPSRLYGDDVRIRQIITNILTNAVKYTHEGTVTFTIDYEIKADKCILHVDVTDTGIGIKEEDLANISVAFKRIEESRNRNIEGTGLGMNITIQLLNMMNSELKVESVYGKGSSFFFYLPQEMVECEPIGNIEERLSAEAEEYEYSTSVYAPDANILVVDDNEMNIKVFKGLLKHTGVKVMDAESGMECLKLVQENYFDIIFMDHMMPELDGIETLQHMKKLDHMCKDTPVIVLTANAVVGAKEMYLSKGFHDFLSKPVIPEKLEEALRNFLPKNKLQSVELATKPERKIKVDDFPQIEGIDWTIAMLHFTDVEFLIEAVTNLYVTLDANLEQIETLGKGIDDPEVLDNYRIKVHAMKSSMAIIGATAHSGLAKLLEYAAKDGEIEFINTMTPYFLRECRKLKANLDEHKPADNRQEANNDLLKTLFVQLKKKVEELDIDGMDDVMNEINKYHVPECDDLIAQLMVDVSNFDMEQIIIKADRILAKL